MRTQALFLVAGGLLAALTVGFLAAQDKPAVRSKAVAQDKPAQERPAPKREEDEKAIRKLSADFLRALEVGDAKAVAAFWTEEGEYVADDGKTLHGRDAIQEAYAKFFAKSPKLKARGEIESIRFVSRDSAIEEGFVRVQKGTAELPTCSRYSFLLAREGGQWRLAVVREWPDEGTSLQDVDWLIGSWVAKTDVAEVRTTYEWDASKKFIRAHFVAKEKDRTVSGTQVIGKDPRTGQLRSWLFESEGGFGEAVWSRDGKRWLLEANGVHADGSEVSATNVLTPIDKDSFTWQALDRTVNGEELPKGVPVKVTRVK